MHGKSGQNWAKLEESLNHIKPLAIKAFPLFSVGCKDHPEMLAKQVLFQLSYTPTR